MTDASVDRSLDLVPAAMAASLTSLQGPAPGPVEGPSMLPFDRLRRVTRHSSKSTSPFAGSS